MPVAVKSGVPHGATESGWLPDCVYTGEKFESGLAFFADALGRITRFSREPADMAAVRRLEGQAALPGLVNTHSHSFQRMLRGRTEQRTRDAQVAIEVEVRPKERPKRPEDKQPRIVDEPAHRSSLVVARWRIGEPVEKFGKRLHESSSSRPISASARPRRPVDWM